MKASEYIERIQELIKIIGDVEVVIMNEDGNFEDALIEIQVVIPLEAPIHGAKYRQCQLGLYPPEMLNLLKVW